MEYFRIGFWFMCPSGIGGYKNKEICGAYLIMKRWFYQKDINGDNIKDQFNKKQGGGIYSLLINTDNSHIHIFSMK